MHANTASIPISWRYHGTAYSRQCWEHSIAQESNYSSVSPTCYESKHRLCCSRASALFFELQLLPFLANSNKLKLQIERRGELTRSKTSIYHRHQHYGTHRGERARERVAEEREPKLGGAHFMRRRRREKGGLCVLNKGIDDKKEGSPQKGL